MKKISYNFLFYFSLSVFLIVIFKAESVASYEPDSALVVIKNNMASYGSGFIFELNPNSAKIITNYHVIRRANNIEIDHLKYSKSYKKENIKIVAVDTVRDIAILNVINFKGFKKEQDEKDDPCGGPISLKEGTDLRNVIKQQQSVYTLTNPANIRNYFTKGIVSGHEIATWLFDTRKNAFPENKEFKYKIILFDAKIAEGSSGGVLLEKSTNRAVGIVTGAVGDGEFSGFAIPIEYVNMLLKAKEKTQGETIIGYDWASKEYPNDPYYKSALYNKKIDVENGLLKSVSGFILGEGDRPLNDVRVLALGKKENSTVSMRLTTTNKDGRFEFEIPFVKELEWYIDIEHKNYKKNPKLFGPFKFPNEFKRFYRLSIIDKFVQEKCIFLRIEDEDSKSQSSIGLERGQKNIFLRGFLMEKQIIKDSNLKWKIKEKFADWLYVSHTNGIAIPRGKRIILRFRSGKNQQSHDIDDLFTELDFVPIDESTNVWRPEFLEVFANKAPHNRILISGYLSVPGGGYPTECIIIRPSLNQKAVGKIEFMDKQGRFEFPISKKYENETIRLELFSQTYMVHDNDTTLLVNKEKNWETNITVYLKNKGEKWQLE